MNRFHYVANKKKNYFSRLDAKNPVLQASEFLIDKLANYVFTALPLEKMSRAETEKGMQENIKTVDQQLEGLSDTYKLNVFQQLWNQSAANNLNDTSDLIDKTYIKPLFAAMDDQQAASEIKTQNRLRIGAKALKSNGKMAIPQKISAP